MRADDLHEGKGSTLVRCVYMGAKGLHGDELSIWEYFIEMKCVHEDEVSTWVR
jgi:hypothetical protein